jgi:hypothetical protein
MKRHGRAIQKINASISNLGLDLSGKVVLTEVGSNEYLYTPIIGALAGAKKVFAWTRDTKYGTAKDIISKCQQLLRKLELIDKVEFYDGEHNEEHLKQADIITNSGFLRPLDKSKLKFTKDSVVIPLMYEKWELRERDVDSRFCKQRKIKLAGTWENHPDLMVFDHIGALAIKMALNAGYEVFRNNIVVWSNDHFGAVAEKAFTKFGAKKVLKTIDQKNLSNNIADIDFIFICHYNEQRNYSSNEIFDIDQLTANNANFGIVHLYGQLNYEILASKLDNVYPKFDGVSSLMTYTLGHVGLNPIINLQVAGLKVGQLMSDNKDTDLVQLI